MLARRTSAAQAFSSPLLGARAVPLVTAADTGGAWEALELVLGPGARSPLHELAADKLFLVTAVTLDADEALVEAGGFVHVPPGIRTATAARPTSRPGCSSSPAAATRSPSCRA